MNFLLETTCLWSRQYRTDLSYAANIQSTGLSVAAELSSIWVDRVIGRLIFGERAADVCDQ